MFVTLYDSLFLQFWLGRLRCSFLAVPAGYGEGDGFCNQTGKGEFIVQQVKGAKTRVVNDKSTIKVRLDLFAVFDMPFSLE